MNDLQPSTLIGSLSSKQHRHVLEGASKMAPDIVPDPTIVHSRRQRIGSWLVIVALLTAVIALVVDAGSGSYIIAAVGISVGLILTRARPAAVTLGSYATVGELAAAAAAGRHSSTPSTALLHVLL